MARCVAVSELLASVDVHLRAADLLVAAEFLGARLTAIMHLRFATHVSSVDMRRVLTLWCDLALRHDLCSIHRDVRRGLRTSGERLTMSVRITLRVVSEVLKLLFVPIKHALMMHLCLLLQ